MKKIFLIISILLVLCGCNKQIIDLNYKFNKAILLVGDTHITVEVAAWNDWEDSDMVQIVAKDGTTYYTHSTNVILINE